MELRHLKYFLEVTKDLNITRAAARLGVSQPPLSRQIKQLEEELETELFDRSQKQLRLTEAGSFFRVKAQQILDQADEAKNSLKRIGSHGHEFINIGFVPSTIYGFLPALLRRYRQSKTKVEISLYEHMTKSQIQQIKNGNIDIGFGRILIQDPYIRQDIILREPLMVVLSKSHPLAQRDSLYLKDIVEERLILYPKSENPNYTDQVTELFYSQNLEPNISTHVRGLQTALGIIASGLGITIVPHSVQKMRSGDVVYIPFKDKELRSPVVMSYRKDETSPVVLNFIKRVRLLSIYARNKY